MPIHTQILTSHQTTRTIRFIQSCPKSDRFQNRSNPRGLLGTKPRRSRRGRAVLSKQTNNPSESDLVVESKMGESGGAVTVKEETVVEEGEGNGEDVPRDAKIVKTLLRSMGVRDYEPRVVHQFLELWYRYVVDVLSDAQTYSEHAGKPSIDCDDVKLAIQTKVNFSFSQPPPREVLLELARSRNKIPLLKSIAGPGIPLPPEQDTLISPNYQLVIPRKRSAQAVEETEEDEEGANPNTSQEQKMDQQQQPPQRVSFPLAAKRPR